MKYDVLIVGGGIAGLTSAAYVGKSGLNGVLCEKNQELGGLVGTFSYQGFSFDWGIRAFENSGILFPMLRQLDIELDFIKSPVRIIIEKEYVEFKDKDSLLEYGNLLKKIFKNEEKNIERISKEILASMKSIDVLYGIDNPLFVNNINDFGYLSKTLMPWFFKYLFTVFRINRMNKSVVEYLKKYTGSQQLIDIICQHFFKGTPAFFALSYFSLYLDYIYPKGGTGAIVNKLSSYAKEKKVDIRKGSKIIEVDLEKKRVKTSKGEDIYFNKLIWAADSTSLYNLIKNPNDIVLSERKKLKELRGNDSVISVFLCVDIKKEQLAEVCGAHCFYTKTSEGLFSIRKGSINTREEILDYLKEYYEKTTYEISCPAIRDENMAPENMAGLIISSLIDYELVKKVKEQGWHKEFKELTIKLITDTLISGALGCIEGRILHSICNTPIDLEEYTGNLGGAITGWSFENNYMPAESRFPMISKASKTKLDNVFQAGQWTFSPSGLPISILTGKLAADDAIKNIKKEG